MRFKEFKLNPLLEAILDEVSMSPGSLTSWANSSEAEGMLMGIEFEMCIPPLSSGGDPVPDLDLDQTAYSIISLAEFYWYDTDYDIFLDQKEQLFSLYKEWLEEKLESFETGEAYESEVIEQAKRRIRAWSYDTAIIQYHEELQSGFDPSDGRGDARLKEIIEELVNTVWNDDDHPYKKQAISMAKRRIREDLVEEQLSEKVWLHNELGIKKYSDAIEELNWPWPYLTKPGKSISFIANDFKNALGLSKINYSKTYHGALREEGVWAIETDSSIITKTRDHMGLEFISPAQPIAQALDSLNKIYKWAKDNECYTNSSTGLHMNISIPDFSLDNLDFIKLAIFSGDKYVLEQFSRIGNSYCNSATDIIQQNITTNNAKQALEKMKSSLNTAASKLIHYGYTDKYTSINTKRGYVEFRGPGGDYLNKSPEQLTLTSLRLAMALKIACDENAHKQEYTKKLYKLIAPGNSFNDTVELFSRYSSGELDRSLLVYYLKRIQSTRADKKQVLTVPQYNGPGKLGQPILLSLAKDDPTAKDWLVWDLQDPSQTYNIHNSLDVIKKTLSAGLHTRDNKWAAAEIITTPQQN